MNEATECVCRNPNLINDWQNNGVSSAYSLGMHTRQLFAPGEIWLKRLLSTLSSCRAIKNVAIDRQTTEAGRIKDKHIKFSRLGISPELDMNRTHDGNLSNKIARVMWRTCQSLSLFGLNHRSVRVTSRGSNLDSNAMPRGGHNFTEFLRP